jgi:uncharacterized protein (TIGR00369 family)
MTSDQFRELKSLFDATPKPDCAALTPLELIDADPEMNWIKMRFAEQPAFRNHFGNVQGGFAVAMLDAVVSIAAFAKTRAWLPTVELKASFLEPLPLGPCIGEGYVIRAGKSLVFLEGRLLTPRGSPAVTAAATALVPVAR